MGLSNRGVMPGYGWATWLENKEHSNGTGAGNGQAPDTALSSRVHEALTRSSVGEREDMPVAFKSCPPLRSHLYGKHPTHAEYSPSIIVFGTASDMSKRHGLTVFQNHEIRDPAGHIWCPDWQIMREVMTFSFCSPMIERMMGANSQLPSAWVVKCKKCGCTINCRAIDPQLEHSQPDMTDPPPKEPVIVSCSCCWTAFRYSPAEVFKGGPCPSNNCRERKADNTSSNKETKKTNNAILIATSLIAAVRLNREEIKPSPAVISKIADSIRLAEMIEARLRK